VGGKTKGGGQRTGTLMKTPYFEAILVKFQEKWRGSCPTLPPVSNTTEGESTTITISI